MAKILIAGDIFPAESNVDLFIKADAVKLLGNELYDRLKAFDYRIFNLEGPLISRSSEISKSGPNLGSDDRAINGFAAMQVDCLSLANNHILDHGQEGLQNTVKVITKSHINYTGAGANLKEAAIPHVFNCGNKKIGLLSCADTEFNIATEHTAGAYPYDPLEIFENIKDLSLTADYVIVLFHGGVEHYEYPTPLLQRICRKMVESGANIVITQHSHCIGAMEKYRDSTIVYGQGNFLFDYGKQESAKTGLLIVIDTDNFKIELVPVEKKSGLVRIAGETMAKRILLRLDERSAKICHRQFVIDNYKQHAEKNITNFYRTSIGIIYYFPLFWLANKISGNKLLVKCFGIRQQLHLLNAIRCDAHRELIISGLLEKIIVKKAD